MPKVLGMEPGTAKIVGIAGLGAVGLFLLTRPKGQQMSGSGGDALLGGVQPGPASGAGYPNAPEAATSYFDREEEEAHKISRHEAFQYLRKQKDAEQFGGQKYTGVVSKSWKALTQGGWENIKNPGQFLTEEQARGLASQNKGPYAQAQGNFFEKAFKWVGDNIGKAAQVYAGLQGKPITLGNVATAAGYDIPQSKQRTPAGGLYKGAYDPKSGGMVEQKDSVHDIVTGSRSPSALLRE